MDLTQVVDLFDEEGMLEEINADDLIIEVEEQAMMTKEKANQRILKKQQKGSKGQMKNVRTEEEEEQFARDYKKMGGIQHIICSATMTIDTTGRITPKMMKRLKKQGLGEKNTVDTLTQLCKTLKFRSKNPKVIDLTETNEEGSQKMPDTLRETAIRCKKEEKDLHTYYFLRENHDDATIIFCNSITCVRRLTSLLSFLKVPNQWPLHSKMQQRQRLKNLDRFKTAVQKVEAGTSGGHGAILVCTDVAARGLDIPFVQNVLHYQSPFNAEVYIHRCGRTARIGREGQVLALLSPEDEKTFKTLRKVVLGNSDETIEPYPISYVQLSKLEPLVEAAQKIELALHRQDKEKKSANWLLKAGKDADLAIDDNLKFQIAETLGAGSAVSGKRKPSSNRDPQVIAAIDMIENEKGARHKGKELSKV